MLSDQMREYMPEYNINIHTHTYIYMSEYKCSIIVMYCQDICQKTVAEEMSEYGTILYIDRSDNARSIADIIVSEYILDINRYYV